MFTEAFMKLSGSVKALLVPANDLYLDKKGLTWELVAYDQDSFAIEINFLHPEYISAIGIDTLKLTFTNTEMFFKPADENIQTLPDGFTMVTEVPPQGKGLLSVQEMLSI